MLLLISDPFDSSMEKKLARFGEVTTDHSRLAEADVIFVRSRTHCTREYIDSAKNLKLIIRGGVGIDNIDSSYASSRGILVKNTPKASSIAVAELTFALMLSVPNRLVMAHQGMKEGRWLKTITRTELYGKKLGLFGLGNIASEVAVRAKAFGMELVGYEKYGTSCSLVPTVETPEEMVSEADYISLHVPLTDETEHIIDETLINACQRQPVVINTGRGSLVDEQAMAAALQDGRISWYAADVYPVEPPTKDYPLLACNNVTFTPHLGSNTAENLKRITDEAVDLLAKLLEGGQM